MDELGHAKPPAEPEAGKSILVIVIIIEIIVIIMETIEIIIVIIVITRVTVIVTFVRKSPHNPEKTLRKP